MLHKYRKTALIEAEQFKATNKQLNDYHIGLSRSRGHHHQVESYYLPTKEGQMLLHIGDYIATGVDGEHWAIDQDIFERTYERVD
ncbi:hypothetical protein [Limosilactobacillus reuteri]|uniref:hypothetical protein n=1 Tax=Limosilactobacillus reuteri TaxID=1598 RepID=UPI00128BAD1D|nr:hypothetical protein [Limosilactobacillus reuteri]MQC00524.1 hypothetical protein [Limosilactobacillus reuteri]HJE41105.1 hypothetical protein [Limosilactobacillus reuteri]